MQLGHDDILEAGALELCRRAEHLGADEAGDIVDDHPNPGSTLGDRARQAVGTRFQCHHVDALSRAVGDLRSLAGLEVETVEAAREIGDALDVESDDSRERFRRSCQALEAHVHPRMRPGARLLDDVGKHAEARRQLQSLDDGSEQLLEPHDRLEIVARRVQAEDHVAAAVGETLENRQQDLLLVVARAVRLDARAEVRRGSDRDPWSRQRVEERARHRRELLVAQQLDHRRDRLGAETAAVARHPARPLRAEQDLA